MLLWICPVKFWAWQSRVIHEPPCGSGLVSKYIHQKNLKTNPKPFFLIYPVGISLAPNCVHCLLPFTGHISVKHGSVFTIITHLIAENSTQISSHLLFQQEKPSCITLLKYQVFQALLILWWPSIRLASLWQCLFRTWEPRTGHSCSDETSQAVWGGYLLPLTSWLWSCKCSLTFFFPQ